jgi:hypothetical protein
MVQETEEDKAGIVSEGSVEVGGDDDIDRMDAQGKDAQVTF